MKCSRFILFFTLCLFFPPCVSAQDCTGLDPASCASFTAWYHIRGTWTGAYKIIRSSCKLPSKLRNPTDKVKIKYSYESYDDESDRYLWHPEYINSVEASTKTFGWLQSDQLSDDTVFSFQGDFTGKSGYYTLTYKMEYRMSYPKNRRSKLKGWVIQDVYWWGSYQCTSKWKALWTRAK